MTMEQATRRAIELAARLGVTGRETVTECHWYAGPSIAEQLCGMESRYPGASMMTPVRLSTEVRVPIDVGAVAQAIWDGEDEPGTAVEFAQLAYDYGATLSDEAMSGI